MWMLLATLITWQCMSLPLVELPGRQEPSLLTPLDADVLRGLKGVNVYVIQLPEILVKSGLDDRKLQAEIERKLAAAGIRYLKPTDREGFPGSPNLYVDVKVVRQETTGDCAYFVDAWGTENVQLERNRRITVMGARVWEAGSHMGWAKPDKLVPVIRQHVMDAAAKYCRDFNSGNRPSAPP